MRRNIMKKAISLILVALVLIVTLASCDIPALPTDNNGNSDSNALGRAYTYSNTYTYGNAWANANGKTYADTNSTANATAFNKRQNTYSNGRRQGCQRSGRGDTGKNCFPRNDRRMGCRCS